MAGFLKRLFGGSSKGKSSEQLVELVGTTVESLIQKTGLDLSFEINETEEALVVELSGGDTDALKDKEGQLIDALQFFVKRVVQHQFPEEKTEVTFDTGGYREEANKALVELAERLKGIVLEKNKSVYLRALPPKDRKIVHQYLANDERVKSKSIGEGLYKKIKIFPANMPEKRGRGPRPESRADGQGGEGRGHNGQRRRHGGGGRGDNRGGRRNQGGSRNNNEETQKPNYDEVQPTTNE